MNVLAMLLMAFLKPAKDTLAVLLLALGDQAALSLSSLYASDFRARLDSVDEDEERSDLSEFARALRESISNCGYRSTSPSSEESFGASAEESFEASSERASEASSGRGSTNPDTEFRAGVGEIAGRAS
jgi:hypothetical protein